ncbi:MAG: Fe2+-dependent dioxygenase [Methylocystis sp.]|uniref:Fe2+-dependent dioxygenase n=1 Tax=Methylocystis sp. TaxID=1911079 RepID=UPI003D0B032B
MLLIDDFYDAAACLELRMKILATPFGGGAATATGMAAGAKNNMQMDQTKGRAILDAIAHRLMSDERIDFYAIPKRIAAMQVNRYDEGMYYENHSDAAIMNGFRCDLSFTLFLEDHAHYDGGELVIEQEHGLLKLKPKIGSVFVYSTGLIHRVEKITRGSRLACVGWIESRVRDEGKRRILRDLNYAHRSYLQRHGRDEIGDLLVKNSGALLRLWCE